MNLKNTVYKFLIAICFLWLSPNALIASDSTKVQLNQRPVEAEQRFTVVKQEFTKTIKKEVPINSDGLANISNKYGKVDFMTWDKNRVRIEVNIIVDARTEEDAQEVFDRININIATSEDEVSAITEIESSSSWFGWGNNADDYRINYTVMIPNTLNIGVTNKYGNVLVESIKGRANVDVKYGNFQLNGVGRLATIELGYGNGTIKRAQEVDAEVKYSKLTIDESQDVSIDSKYSKIWIESAGYVNSMSSYDNYKLGTIERFRNDGKYDDVAIDQVADLEMRSKYSNLRVTDLSRSMDVEMRYGGATVDNVHAEFSEIRVNGAYADFKLNIAPEAGYRLKATADYAGISVPDRLQVTYENETGTEHILEGHTSSNPSAVVNARLDYGGLRIR